MDSPHIDFSTIFYILRKDANEIILIFIFLHMIEINKENSIFTTICNEVKKYI